MMYRVSDEEATNTWGSSLRIAAQGAILKKDDSFRIVHDGTHGVRVNPEIKPRDQVRRPTAGDFKTQMEVLEERAEVNFALEADVSKAHRRCLIRPSDHGLQCCRLGKGTIWVNRVGCPALVIGGPGWLDVVRELPGPLLSGDRGAFS